MPKANRIVKGQPWTIGVEKALRERPGVMLVSLLTDEAGCLALVRGELPEYLIQQAEDALGWCGTRERGVCTGDRVDD